MENLEKVKRVEVITQNGREYHNWSANNSVKASIQDEGTTLKIFISKVAASPQEKIAKEMLKEMGINKDIARAIDFPEKAIYELVLSDESIVSIGGIYYRILKVVDNIKV